MTISDRVLTRKRTIIETVNNEWKTDDFEEHKLGEWFDVWDFFVIFAVSFGRSGLFSLLSERFTILIEILRRKAHENFIENYGLLRYIGMQHECMG